MTPPRLRNYARRMRRSRRASGASCNRLSLWRLTRVARSRGGDTPMTKLHPAVTQTSPCRLSGLPVVEYHAMRALSASGAWLLAEECAAKFLWRSPWNPLYLPEAKTEFDIGVAAHLAVLEPGRQADSIVVIEAGDYRSSKAREARDAARASGKVPLLPYQLDIVQAIAGSIRAHPIAAPAFKGGEAEVTLTWCDPETGIPCKARPDYLPAHGQWLVDLKTAASAN